MGELEAPRWHIADQFLFRDLQIALVFFIGGNALLLISDGMCYNNGVLLKIVLLGGFVGLPNLSFSH
ncbi:MAG: hypothetical protein ACK5PB_05220 [Pirellula sp.]|jgi:hypothetical protein